LPERILIVPSRAEEGKTGFMGEREKAIFFWTSSGAPSVIVMAPLVSPPSQKTGTLPGFQIDKFLSDIVKFFGS
jgi:hypothetical protein